MINTVRAVWRYNKSTGVQGTVALNIPSSIDGENVGPQGMVIDASPYGEGLAFGTTATQTPILARQATQKLGIKTETDKTFFSSVVQNLAIRTTATKDRLQLKIRSVTQNVGIRTEGIPHSFVRTKPALQRLGIRSAADADTSQRIKVDAAQTLGIKTDATRTRVRLIIRSVIQRLGISSKGEKSITHKLSIVERPSEFIMIDASNSSFLVYSAGFRASHPITGGTTTGFVRYEGSWFTTDNTNDYLRQFDEDFTHIGFTDLSGSITLPHALGVFRQYMIIGNRADDSIYFTTGVGVVQFSVPLHADNGRIAGLAADDTHIYTVDQTENQIFRYEVTLGTNSATFGAPTRWNIDGTGPRGMGISGKILYVINSKREVKAYSTTDGSYLGVVFIVNQTHPGLGSNFNPQAIYADVSPYGGGLGSMAIATSNIVQKSSTTQTLGLKTDTIVSYAQMRSAIQRIGLSSIPSLARFRTAEQRLGVRTAATSNKITLVVVSIVQRLGLSTSADYLPIKHAIQRLGVRTEAERERFRLKPRSVAQKLGIRSTAAKTTSESAKQTLGIRTTATAIDKLTSRAFQRLGINSRANLHRPLSVKDAIGVSTSTANTFFREATQRLGVRTAAVRDRLRLKHRSATQSLGVKTDANTKSSLKRSVKQGLRISKTAATDHVRRIPRSVTQRLGVRTEADHKRVVPREADQHLGISTSASSAVKVIRSVIQRLGIHGPGARNIPSDAPIFRLKDNIRRIFRV